MSENLHSFIDIFEPFQIEGETITLKKIEIPMIQRDYAQGRNDPKVDKVRNRFLNALRKAITEKPITLDFVYGDIDDQGVLTPLDGQQRLTTLYLLHWYAAQKENIPVEEKAFLQKFSYETRYSARNFCKKLCDFIPSFEEKLSDEIVDQSWFPLDWKNDPTIHSMLVMLDDIDKQFKDVPEIWNRLKDNAITFYFRPIRDMGLTDEIYIKMNSRGKPLTQFEHFKAELEKNIREIDEKTADRIISKIDREWTRLLWKYRISGIGRAEDNIIDNEFLRYFRFVCNIITYRNSDTLYGKTLDEFDLLQMYFSKQCNKFQTNIDTLESFFDCWCSINGYDSPETFLKAHMSITHEPGKIMSEGKRFLDIFGECLHSNSFITKRLVLLYAIVVYLQNQDSVTEEEFTRRLRIVNNLVQNSEDAISERSDNNRIISVIFQTESIIKTGSFDETGSIKNMYNVHQVKEEKEKIEYLEKHPDMAETLFRLEDHPRLYGQISIIGLDHLDYTDRFFSLFTCNLDKIDCALMACGDYGQSAEFKNHYQYGSSKVHDAWDTLFHQSSSRKGFENTSRCLNNLLSKAETFTNESLDAIAAEYIAECEEKNIYTFGYYYIKYPSFRPGKYGKMRKMNRSDPYLFSVMLTASRANWNSYIPYLKEADAKHLNPVWGEQLLYSDRYIECIRAGYVVKSLSDNAKLDTIEIKQNDGIDSVDRIILLKEYIANEINK